MGRTNKKQGLSPSFPQKWEKQIRKIIREELQEALVYHPHLTKEQILDNHQMMQWLHISRGTLARLRNEGLPYHRIGRKICYHKSEVEQFFKGSGPAL